MAKRLLLVRHGRPAGVTAGCLLGATDPPLDPAGLPLLESLAARVRQFAPQTCWCSPMVRCRQTAEVVADSLPVRFDPDLREIDFGRWENRTFTDVARSDPELIDRWAAFDPAFAFPGGESLGSFLDRVHTAADRLAAEPADTVLAVAHGGVVRSLVCRYLGLEPSRYVLFDVAYAALAVIELHEGKGVLKL